MSARYALYFAPLSGSALAAFGARWLGRAAEGEVMLPQPVPDGFDGAQIRTLTEAPRHYGFHGTLKPPFHLADGRSAADLHHALEDYAARQVAFVVDRLALQAIGDFLALVPVQGCQQLTTLAEMCVTAFDHFRAPLETSELAKRRAAGLTSRQAELLARWGYPYVLDEFRFHLTLTGPIQDPVERDRLTRALAPLLVPTVQEPVPVRELCLFHQLSRETPFRLVRRYPFGP